MSASRQGLSRVKSATVGNPFHPSILEYSLGANPMIHELVEEAFPVVQGMLEIPDRPGLGLTVRADFVARYRKD